MNIKCPNCTHAYQIPSSMKDLVMVCDECQFAFKPSEVNFTQNVNPPSTSPSFQAHPSEKSNISPYSRSTYIINAQFFGMFGAHNFYAQHLKRAKFNLALTLIGFALLLFGFIGIKLNEENSAIRSLAFTTGIVHEYQSEQLKAKDESSESLFFISMIIGIIILGINALIIFTDYISERHDGQGRLMQ